MTILVVGISHRSAPISLLERLAIDRDGTYKLVEDVLANPHVTEATAVVTCNRLEIYAAVDRFHGSVEDLSQRLLEPAGGSVEALLPHLYVHYDDGAVSHLFQVAAGLDSMAVGEAQILGQTRAALARGQEQGSVGPVLNTLFQQALRVGKRAHAETGIDRVGTDPGLRRARPGRPTTWAAAGSWSSARVGWPASPLRPSYAVTRRGGRGQPQPRARAPPRRGVRRALGAADRPRRRGGRAADVVVACAGATRAPAQPRDRRRGRPATGAGRPGPAPRHRPYRQRPPGRHPGHPRRSRR